MRGPCMSGNVTRAQYPPSEGDRWARSGSKLRCVWEVLSDGQWHTGSELHEAYNRLNPYGDKEAWSMPSAIAQLRAKLREKREDVAVVGDIESERIEGRDEFRYRMVLPRQAAVKPHLERTERVLAEMGQGRLGI